MKKPASQKSTFLAAITTAILLSHQLHAQTATALVNNAGTQQLLSFSVTTPGTTSAALTISGLLNGQSLVGIDYRPIDAVLIGLGYNSTTGSTGVYSFAIGSGVATSINTNTLTLATGLARITIDFNPTANAIRVVTSAATGNDFRITAAGAGTITPDTDLNPANTGIRATAYSRNNAGGGTNGATTLYEIDGTNNALVTQGSVDFTASPVNGTSPNTGTLTTVANLTGVTGSAIAGFEIFNAAGTATTSAGTAYVATTAGSLATLALSGGTAGAATTVGTIGGTYTTVTDVTVQSPVPEPASILLLGMATVGFATRRFRKLA